MGPGTPCVFLHTPGCVGYLGVCCTAQSLSWTADEATVWPGAAYTATTAEEEAVPVTYNYSFFHLVFALASMYIAMLMTGWGTNPQERDLIDVGWTSVWVKLVTQWVTAATYIWMLIAPAVFPDRDFSL